MAGGVPAGRLSIEIVAEIARLQSDLDKAKRMVSAASGDIAKSAKAANDNLSGIGSGLSKAGKSNSRTLTQLSFQLNDVATMAASGSGAFQIFATQAGQIFQVAQMAEGGLKGFAAEIGGAALKFGPFIIALAAAAGGFELFQRSISSGIDTKAMIASLGLTHAEIKLLKDTSIDASDVIAAAFQVMAERAGISLNGMGKMWSGVLDWMTTVGRNAMAGLYSNVVGTFNAIGAAVNAVRAGKDTMGVLADVGKAYKSAFDDANKALTQFGKDVTKQASSNKLAELQKQAAAIKADRTPKKPKVDHRAENLAREMEATNALIDGLYKLADAYGVSDAAAMQAEVTAKAREQGIKKQADVTAWVAQQMRKATAEQVVAGAKTAADLTYQAKAQSFVNDAVKAGALATEDANTALQDMAQQRGLITAMNVASANRDVKGYEAAKKALQDLTDAQIANNKETKRRADQEQTDQINRSIKDVQLETKLTKDLGEARIEALQGLSGNALDDKLASIAAQHEKIAIQEKAELDKVRLLALGYNDAAAAVMLKAQADKTQVDVKYQIDKQTTAVARLNEELRDTVDLFGNMVGLPKSANVLFDMAQGNTPTAPDAFGAAVEANKMIGKIVGFKGGPFGIFQSFVDKLFKKIKWGSVQLSSSGVSGSSGNSNKSEQAALTSGKGIFSSLTDLASQLGGSLGDFGNIAVGVRGGKYRVNTTGTSLKKKKGAVDFGDDADAAVAYAIKQAIEMGAINGIRQSTNNLLKAGDDLSAQINKALSFESVFTDLKAYTDPLGAALDTVNKQFSDLRSIFDEAGASAEEYAQLEQLLTIKRNEAMQKESDALDDVRSRIADAQGDQATVIAIERAQELRDAYDDNVRSELKRLYAIEDATAAQDAQTAAMATAAQAQIDLISAASSRNALQTRILELLGRSEDSLASSRLAELATTDKALQPLQSMVYQLEDLTGIVDKFGPLADDLRDFKKELLGLTSAASFSSLAATFRDTAAAAKMGDATALGNLQGVSKDYLDAAKENSATQADYQRAVGEVMNAVDQGIFAADAQVDYAKAQVEALDRAYRQDAENNATNRTLLEALVSSNAQVARLMTRFEATGMPTVPVE